MAYHESPSLDEYKEGIPDKIADTSRRRKIILGSIFGLAGLALLLWLVLFFSSGSMAVVLRTGAVEGRVLDGEGNPLPGEVFILGRDAEVEINSEGYFFLEDIPTGYQSLVVAHHGAAEEYPVVIETGSTVNMGEIEFLIVTQVPDPE